MRPKDLILPALLAALTGILSYLQLPLPISPVPVTGQTLGVMLAGALLTPRQAGLSMVTFLLLGIIGAPVFAGGQAGPGVLAGPSGGFLIGFVLGAMVIAALKGTGKPWRLTLAVLVGGLVTVYIPGVLWMSRVLDINLSAALSIGVLPFIPGDLLKAAIAVLAARRILGRTTF